MFCWSLPICREYSCHGWSCQHNNTSYIWIHFLTHLLDLPSSGLVGLPRFGLVGFATLLVVLVVFTDFLLLTRESGDQ